MEYLVMECSLSYAVVLDGKGRYLKVPNLGYKVGQILDHVVVPDSPSKHQAHRRHITRWLAMAACLCLMVLGGWLFWQSPVGTVRMQINPDVQMSVNRFDRVIGLEGLNEDGKVLVKACQVYGKTVETASDVLADRAMEMGFLRDGGQITLTVESKRENWKNTMEETLLLELEHHFASRVTVVTASEKPDSSSETIVIAPGQEDDESGPHEAILPSGSLPNNDEQESDGTDDDSDDGDDDDDGAPDPAENDQNDDNDDGTDDADDDDDNDDGNNTPDSDEDDQNDDNDDDDDGDDADDNDDADNDDDDDD